ncbi:MAG: porin, partial [Planctomycetes bacterium]|nr:porin [Planctomycetota bacterium]
CFLQTVLIGNQKRPYGLDHLNSSRYNVFIERPFVTEALNQDARRIGVASYGNSEDLAWNWRYGVFNMANVATEGRYVGDTLQPEIAARLAHTAWYDEESEGRNYAHFAVSGSIAWPDGNPSDPDAPNEARFRTRPEARTESRWLDTGRIADTEHYGIVGVETALNFGPVQVVAEAQQVWLHRSGPMRDLEFYGAYVYVSYFLTGEHMPWDRKSGTLGRPKPAKNFKLGHGLGAWQVAARYSYADLSDEDVLGGVGRAVTLAVNWYWNPNASLQLNYTFGDIFQRDVFSPTAGRDFRSGDYELFGARFRVDF